MKLHRITCIMMMLTAALGVCLATAENASAALPSASLTRNKSAKGSRQIPAKEIKGCVLDENGQPLPYANVILRAMPDSTIITGVVTEEDGRFSIPASAIQAATDAVNGTAVNNDGLVLQFAMIGYRTLFLSPEEAGTVRMEPEAEFLGEAVVKATMPKTRLSDQGLLTSVRGSVLETAGTAMDALGKVPGLIAGQNGLEVLGKGAPLIYINGRKVVDASELQRLQRLQSNEIQSIEVITNPGAQYSASVRAVVRIRTIRHQGDGFGFNLGLEDQQSLRQSFNDPSGYLNMNVRHNGLDVFAGVNALKFTSLQQSDMHGEVHGEDGDTPAFLQDGDLYFRQIQTNGGGNLGANWQINDNHSVGARVEMDASPRIDVVQSIAEDIYKSGELIDKLVSDGNHHNDNTPSSLKANAYYNGQVGKLGIDFNTDFYRAGDSQDAHTVEHSSMGDDAKVDYLSHSSSQLYAAKLVLTYPVWKGALQAGTEDTFSRRSSDYSITSDLVPSSASQVKEDEIALFASYGFYVPKAGQFSAGLRYEHVNYSYDDLMGTDDLNRRYDNVFPTVAWANAFGPVQMQLSYSAKTTRPDFSSLSSSVRYHSRYILQSGNARLQPQVSHDMGFNLNWKFLTMITQYTRVDDGIAQWSELYNNDGIVLVHPINLDTPMRSMAWYVNASPTIGVWSMNYTAGVQQQWLRIGELDFSNKPMWVAQLYNSFRLKGGWQLECGGEFHSKSFYQNAYLFNNYLNLTAAVQKSFLNNALVIRLAATDLAGLANYDVETECSTHFIRQTNTMDTKRITLSLRYNFNTAASKYKGTGAGREAASRM